MKILVTGGAGYIGSHTVIELLKENYEVVIVDNFYNSSAEAVRRVEELAGQKIPFYQVDIRDKEGLSEVVEKERPEACIHFAGLKAVGESVSKPVEYYDNNINGTLVLIDVLRKYNVKKIIFSSSATVYGTPETVPVTESCRKGICTNPYGWTKWMIEQILTDLQYSDPEWKVTILRYFNPIGAHESGMIGEDPVGIPNNLMPYITQVAVGKREKLSVYGDDYNTHDGTGVRDYIHVVDLAKGHVAALHGMEKFDGVNVYNLGTGTGYSVLDVVNAFEKATGVKVPYQIAARRPGDIDAVYSDPEKAYNELGWKAEFGIERMCKDSWNWQSKNPNGYR